MGEWGGGVKWEDEKSLIKKVDKSECGKGLTKWIIFTFTANGAK